MTSLLVADLREWVSRSPHGRGSPCFYQKWNEQVCKLCTFSFWELLNLLCIEQFNYTVSLLAMTFSYLQDAMIVTRGCTIYMK